MFLVLTRATRRRAGRRQPPGISGVSRSTGGLTPLRSPRFDFFIFSKGLKHDGT